MRISYLFVLAIFLSACATPPSPQISNVNKKEETVTFKFDLSNSGYSERAVIDALKSAVDKDMVGSAQKSRTNGSSGVYDVRGGTVTSACSSDSLCQITLKFYRGEYFSSTSSEKVTVQTMTIPVEIKNIDNNTVAIMTLNYSPEVTYGRNPIFVKYDPLIDEVNLMKAYDRLKNINPVVDFRKTYKDEFQVDSNDNVVYGNFKRELGFMSSRWVAQHEKDTTKIGKKNTFKLSTPTEEIPLYLDIYPSRVGALVNYQFSLEYKAFSDGTTNYSEEQSKAFIKTIIDVANI